MVRYKRYFESGVELLYNRVSEIFYKKGYSIGNIITEIRENIKKYERDPLIRYIEKLKNYFGLKGILFSNKKYILYRGLFFSKDINNSYYQDIDLFKKEKIFKTNTPQISWTTNMKSALSFATGSKHSFDRNHLTESRFGIIIKYIPKENELFYDFQFVEDEYDIYSAFSEDEVICWPSINKFKIVKIIEGNQ